MGFSTSFHASVRPLALAAGLLLSFGLARGQSSSSADAAWAALSSASSGGTVSQELLRLQTQAQNAQAFFTQFPTDSRSPAARKLHVMANLQAAQIGGGSNQAALTLANSYCADAGNPVNDRVDVAFTAGVMALPPNGGRLIDQGPAYKGLIDSLYAQFGAQDRIFSLYVQAMESTDPDTALAVANKLVALNAPSFALGPAQEVIARQGLVGGPLDITLTQYGGQPLNLATPAGVPTLIYFWSNGSDTHELSILNQYKGSIPASTRVIYISLQANMAQVASAEAKAPMPGIFCFQVSGLNTREETYFGVLQLPSVYVLDKNGILRGFGRPENIPSLLQLVSP